LGKPHLVCPRRRGGEHFAGSRKGKKGTVPITPKGREEEEKGQRVGKRGNCDVDFKQGRRWDKKKGVRISGLRKKVGMGLSSQKKLEEQKKKKNKIEGEGKLPPIGPLQSFQQRRGTSREGGFLA